MPGYSIERVWDGEARRSKNDLYRIQPGAFVQFILKLEATMSGRGQEVYRDSGRLNRLNLSDIPYDGSQTVSMISDQIPGGSRRSAAVVLASILHGGSDHAVKHINASLGKMGLSNTNLRNVRGLDNIDQFTCLRDLVQYFSFQLKNGSQETQDCVRSMLGEDLNLGGSHRVWLALKGQGRHESLVAHYGFEKEKHKEVFARVRSGQTSGLVDVSLLDMQGFISASGGNLIGFATGSDFGGVTYHPDRLRRNSVAVIAEGVGYGVDRSQKLEFQRSASLTIGIGSDPVSPAIPHLQVKNVTQTLRRVARVARDRFSGKVFCVTGSAGKSTTSSLIAKVLEGVPDAGRTHMTFNNGNLLLGTLETMMTVPADAKHIVAEIAAGRVKECSEICRPDVAVVTNVSNAHRKAYKSLEDIAREKAGVFSGLKTGGAAVICRDSDCYEIFHDEARKFTSKIIRYGTHQDSDWRMLHYDSHNGALRISVAGAEIDIRFPAVGEHIAVNAVGAMAAASHLYRDWKLAISGLAGWSLLDGRGRAHDITLSDKRTIRIIDESFNAAPGAVIAVLKTLNERPAVGRRIVVLGDMLELGDASTDCHMEVLSFLNGSNIDMAYFVGDEYRKALQLQGLEKPHICHEAANGVLSDLLAYVRQGDEVTVKGAHATEVHSIVRDIRNLSVPNIHVGS